MIYKILLRPILFLFDPESVHNFILKLISTFTFLNPLFRLVYYPRNFTGVRINNLAFKHPLGLAAGFDKNGIAIGFWEAIGFSHVEIGTVTPLPQPGNPKPRIFRLKKDEALINRLGFNNSGADSIRENILKARKKAGKDFIIGVNIGKNKITPIEKAAGDYKTCFEKLYDAADYFTVNVSSPNTEGLRDLHQKEYLHHLLSEIQNLNRNISQQKSLSLKAVFLKISPDLSGAEVKEIYETAVSNRITGIIATNTTLSREELTDDINEAGGLSGKPLKERSDKILETLNELNSGNEGFFLIGIGGVFNRKDYLDKMRKGAAAVQVYTGFIYEGPSLTKKIIN